MREGLNPAKAHECEPDQFADVEHVGKRKKTKREVFLAEMEVVVPWKAPLKIIEIHYPVAG